MAMDAACTAWNKDPESCDKVRKGESHDPGVQKAAYSCGHCASVKRIVKPHAQPVHFLKNWWEKVSTSRQMYTDF